MPTLKRHHSQLRLIKAEQGLLVARLFERKRLEFEGREQGIAELRKRAKVSDNGNYRELTP